MKMHDGEADIDAALVRELVAAQFPRLAALPDDSLAERVREIALRIGVSLRSARASRA